MRKADRRTARSEGVDGWGTGVDHRGHAEAEIKSLQQLLAGASDEEQYYAAAAARELRGRGRAEGAALDATGHILLQDYLEYVGGFAVGMEALCAFFARCFP